MKDIRVVCGTCGATYWRGRDENWRAPCHPLAVTYVRLDPKGDPNSKDGERCKTTTT